MSEKIRKRFMFYMSRIKTFDPTLGYSDAIERQTINEILWNTSLYSVSKVTGPDGISNSAFTLPVDLDVPLATVDITSGQVLFWIKMGSGDTATITFDSSNTAITRSGSSFNAVDTGSQSTTITEPTNDADDWKLISVTGVTYNGSINLKRDTSSTYFFDFRVYSSALSSKEQDYLVRDVTENNANNICPLVV